MIALLRCLLIPSLFIIYSLAGIIFCLFRPKHPNNTKLLALGLHKIFAPLLGIKLIIRDNKNLPKSTNTRNHVFIANHQSNYDLVCFGAAFHNNTLCIGKKSIRWIPFFGQIFWLAGNLFIDRKNRDSAINTIKQVSQSIVSKKVSIWLFPEGTRSNGQGLLPFKMGAFHTALQAKVSIVPVVLSSTERFSLNKLNNGYAILKTLDPIETHRIDNTTIKKLATISHSVIKHNLALLDREVAALNSQNIH